MFNIRKLLAQNALFLTLVIPTVSLAQSGPLTNGVNECGVPVCSITMTVEALGRLPDGDSRYRYTNKLVNKYDKSKDVTILENLLAAAIEIKALSVELNDADWVVREVSTLANNSILNLAKYSKVDIVKLTALFKRLDSPQKRFEVIEHFQGEINSIEDLDILNRLVQFALNAKEVSLSMNDEKWIPRAAALLASEITVKLTALDPAHEGVYEVKVIHGNLRTLNFDKIIILDSSAADNLVVQFINTKLKQIVYKYTHASIIGNIVSGKFLSSGSESSEFNLIINRETGEVKGQIVSTRNGAMVFKGQQKFSTRTIFSGSAPVGLSELDVLGTMDGMILGIKGTLSINKYTPNSYSASFVAYNGLIVLDFMGKFYSKKGVLSLTHKDKIKLTLGLRNTTEALRWQGVSYSTTNGRIIESSFTPLN